MAGPVITPAFGERLTVTEAPTAQVPIVYEILVVPTVSPVTRPAETLATAPDVLLQIPPPTVSVKATVFPVHTIALVGASGAGVERTLTAFTAAHPKPLV